ncbi:LOW QUALITY PROTEIN: Hypothetical protein PHPALM_13223 [Phytophthora palmivora]|uniref:Gag protein n=1 Tax=Phytophthora palmivora TaxID=4796 RepID=A0A2P4XXZ4_9STRA|nr:LOW QUALITY PROTEIN: Hypothetical protein PHPALM_13223 [Phytophthora palmivora]
MDGLKVGPSRTQLFRVHANSMEEAIQIALQEEYSHRPARTPTSVWQGHDASTGVVQGPSVTGASTGPVPMELDLSPHGRSADGARHGGLAPESLGALETRKSSGGLLVVHASVWGYGDPFRVLIDSGASTNLARHQTVARNGGKYADALCESKGRGQVSVRLADGMVVNVPGVRMALAVTFEDFDSTESFLVLDMDKYDLILGMPSKSPWSADGARHGGLAPESLAVRDWGARDGRQGSYVPEEVLGVTDSNEGVAMSLSTGRETTAHCQACGIATTASPIAESRRGVWASTVAVPDGTDQAGNIGPQAGNIGPQAAEAAEESADGVSCLGNIDPQVGNIGPQAGNVVPQAGNIGPQAAEAAGEGAESASGVGNIVPREVEETEKIESAVCVSSVGNRVRRGVKKTSTRVEVLLNASRVDNKAPHSESETPPARPVEEQFHVFDGVSGRQVKAGVVRLEALPEVSALLNLEELSIKASWPN